MSKNISVKVSLLVFLLLNISVWFYARPIQSLWLNIPPPPGASSLKASALGDASFAYRSSALTIQSLGDTGGRSVNLNKYNYVYLGGWFEVLDDLDQASNYMPNLAGFYFSNARDPKNVAYIVKYLEKVGERADGNKWRWLAHAVYLARYSLKDNDLALRLANKLAKIYKERDDLPIWAGQMPAIVMMDEGKDAAALRWLLNLLDTEHDTLHPNEVNVIKDMICTRVWNKEVAKGQPLCDGFIDE